jgi:putative phage-type endonuclease
MEQRTPEWVRARTGKVTASRMSDLMAEARARGGESVSRRQYRWEKILERITGKPKESTYVSVAMQNGIDREGRAREEYAKEFLVDVSACGFVQHPTIEMAGASPDGLVLDEGVLEIKCPTEGTYGATLEAGKLEIPREYALQIQWQLACMPDRKWCDYVVYQEDAPLLVLRVPRDEQMIGILEDAVRKFLDEVEKGVQLVRRRAQRP